MIIFKSRLGGLFGSFPLLVGASKSGPLLLTFRDNPKEDSALDLIITVSEKNYDIEARKSPRSSLAIA
jgi:hypothetical protein